MSAIEIKNLRKSFDNFKLEIDYLNIEKGYITGFVGPNGSGKTTTIKLIMNMIKKQDGKIKILGKEYEMDDLDIKEVIGYVGEKSGYYQEAKIREIKKSISEFYKNWDEELYKTYINRLEIDESKRYKDLSKGNQKKFELVMSLSHHPKIIIMDEPTANLDPLVRNEFLEILQERIEEDNATVFYSTHITSDLDKVSDYIVFINKGKIILKGEKDNLLENHCIVRGKNELLTDDTKDLFIRVNKSSYNFDGLCNNKNLAYEIFGEEVFYDRPNLEDILSYYTKG